MPGLFVIRHSTVHLSSNTQFNDDAQAYVEKKLDLSSIVQDMCAESLGLELTATRDFCAQSNLFRSQHGQFQDLKDPIEFLRQIRKKQNQAGDVSSKRVYLKNEAIRAQCLMRPG